MEVPALFAVFPPQPCFQQAARRIGPSSPNVKEDWEEAQFSSASAAWSGKVKQHAIQPEYHGGGELSPRTTRSRGPDEGTKAIIRLRQPNRRRYLALGAGLGGGAKSALRTREPRAWANTSPPFGSGRQLIVGFRPFVSGLWTRSGQRPLSGQFDQKHSRAKALPNGYVALLSQTRL